MIIATVYPGGPLAIILMIGGLLLGVFSILLFLSGAIAGWWLSVRRMYALLRIAYVSAFCAASMMFLAMAWIAIDEIRNHSPLSLIVERSLADWPYCAGLFGLFGVEVLLGRLLQRRKSLSD